MAGTMLRAGFIRSLSNLTRRPGISGDLGQTRKDARWPSGRACTISAGKRQSMVNKAYPNRVNNSSPDLKFATSARHPPSHSDGLHPGRVGVDQEGGARERDTIGDIAILP